MAAISAARRIARRVGLDDQQGAGRAVEAHRPVVLDGVDRGPVHQLHQRRPQRSTASATTASAAACTVGNVATSVDRAACGRHQPQDRPGDDAERALAADEQLEQREPGDVLDPLAAEGDQRAVGEHDVEAEHVVGGDAVLHAAQAAGVGGDVAADRADLERRRVRRVPEAVLGARRPSPRR